MSMWAQNENPRAATLGFSFDVIGKYRASAQEVGVGTGHGCGNDSCKQQSADDGGHGIDGQYRQGVTCAHRGKLVGTELAHID